MLVYVVRISETFDLLYFKGVQQRNSQNNRVYKLHTVWRPTLDNSHTGICEAQITS
jgi:hypothetical protein